MSIIDKLCLLIDEYEEKEFMTEINNIPPEELKQVNFKQITEKLKGNEEFSDTYRLEYAKRFDLGYFNQIVNDVRKAPFECRYNLLLSVSLNVKEFQNELLNVALLRSAAGCIINEFSETLSNHGIYDEFKTKVLSGSNKESIIHWLLYIEPSELKEYYPSLMALAHEIAETDVFNDFLSGKSRYLLKLSEFVTELETIKYVKEQMVIATKKEQQSAMLFYQQFGDALGTLEDFPFSKELKRREKIIDDNFQTAQSIKKM